MASDRTGVDERVREGDERGVDRVDRRMEVRARRMDDGGRIVVVSRRERLNDVSEIDLCELWTIEPIAEALLLPSELFQRRQCPKMGEPCAQPYLKHQSGDGYRWMQRWLHAACCTLTSTVVSEANQPNQHHGLASAKRHRLHGTFTPPSAASIGTKVIAPVSCLSEA